MIIPHIPYVITQLANDGKTDNTFSATLYQEELVTAPSATGGGGGASKMLRFRMERYRRGRR